MDGAIAWLSRLVDRIEASRRFQAATIGEPHLARHGLYPRGSLVVPEVLVLLDKCDGRHDLHGAKGVKSLLDAGVIEECGP